MSSSPSLSELHHLQSQRVNMQTIMYHQALAVCMGLNGTDHKCLVFLLDGPRTAGELAEIAGLTTGTLTAVIDRLEKRGYVRRIADAKDRRKIFIEAVSKNLAPLRSALASIAQAMQTLEARYTTEQLATISDYLTRADNILYEETLRLKEMAAR